MCYYNLFQETDIGGTIRHYLCLCRKINEELPQGDSVV